MKGSMLYDVFISHASEDKDEFVRPLAEALRKERVEVWFDEFSLMPGMSLRRSIDLGLAKSRFGIVVLSPSFFNKSWPEWELNGLVQRHLAGSQNVLLPLWHGVSRDEVASYSPSLADIIAMRSADGLVRVTEQILHTVQPSGSALVLARNLILERGYEPPVISDDWWLDVIEGAEGQHGYRWHFPIYQMTESSSARGESLAWVVMQHLWQEEAESRPITQMTPPDEIVQFIASQPGLMEVCERIPRRLLEFAPQLAIPGFAGTLEQKIEEAFQMSVREYADRRTRQDKSGSALTTNGLCPACEEEFALRHPTFGDYEPAMVACGFVQGNGGGVGPHTKAYPAFDHLIWLLSSRSNWLPRSHHAYLLQGMKEWTVWPWMGNASDSDYDGTHSGALWRQLHDALAGSNDSITLTNDAKLDLSDRIQHCREILGLSESVGSLTDRFVAEQVIEIWLSEERKMRARRHA
jgi:hypothetical protein